MPATLGEGSPSSPGVWECPPRILLGVEWAAGNKTTSTSVRWWIRAGTSGLSESAEGIAPTAHFLPSEPTGPPFALLSLSKGDAGRCALAGGRFIDGTLRGLPSGFLDESGSPDVRQRVQSTLRKASCAFRCPAWSGCPFAALARRSPWTRPCETFNHDQRWPCRRNRRRLIRGPVSRRSHVAKRSKQLTVSADSVLRPPRWVSASITIPRQRPAS